MRRTAGFALGALLLTLTLSFSTYAQPADMWLRTYDDSDFDSFRGVVATEDGGHTTLLFSDGEISLMKLDASGTMELRHPYAPVSANFPELSPLLRTPDGGYSFRYGDGDNTPLVHTDRFGRELWRVQVDNPGFEMALRDDGGYVLASITNYPYQVKLSFLDEYGMLEFEQTYDPTGGILYLGGIEADGNGNFYVFCAQQAVSYDLVQVYKVDSAGDLLWWRSVDGFSHTPTQCIGGFVTDDGGCVWYGAGYNQLGLYQFDHAALAARLPADGGEPLWVRSYEEDVLGVDDEKIIAGVAGDNGDVYLIGDLASQPAVISVDQYGSEQWRYLGPSLGNGFTQYYYFGATFDETDASLHLFGQENDVHEALLHVFNRPEPDAQPQVAFAGSGSTEIPANGGTLYSAVQIENPTNQARQVRIRRDAILPNGTSYVLDNIQYTLAPGQMIDLPNHMQMIPAGAPAGEYVHRLSLLTANNAKLSSQAYFFTKAGAAADGNGAEQNGDHAWTVTELNLPAVAVDASSTSTLPTGFAVGAVYPNPFNATARFDITLPETQQVSARVFDTTGRQVAEITNASYSAGTHTLTIAPTALASGVYFLQVKVGTEQAMRKLVLVK